MTTRDTFDPFGKLEGNHFGKLHADPKVRGHYVRVFDTGERISYFRRKVNGHDVKGALGVFDATIPKSREIPKGIDPSDYIGTRPSLNKEMARTLALTVGGLVDRGINPFQNVKQKRTAREGELRLGDAFDDYEAGHLIPRGRRRATDLRQMFERYLGAMPEGAKKKHGKLRTKSEHGVDWSRKRLSEITSDDVRALRNKLKKGHSGYVANRVTELGRALYGKLIEWSKGTVTDNPFAGHEPFEEVERERFVNASEAPAFFKALNALPASAFKDFVWLLLFTGARRANVLGMRWDQLDLVGETWTIPAHSSKSRKSMTVPLTARAVELLTRRRAADPHGVFVFPANSKAGHMTPPKKQWKAFMKSAELTDLRLHDLRRSLGSWAVNTGASLAVVGKALGHKSHQSTAVYARLQVDPVRDAMMQAQEAMLRAAEPTPLKAPVIPIGKKKAKGRVA